MTKWEVEMELPYIYYCIWLEIACANFVMPVRLSNKLLIVYLYPGIFCNVFPRASIGNPAITCCNLGSSLKACEDKLLSGIQYYRN